MSNKTKILYVSQEILPFTPETPTAQNSRSLPQAVHEGGKETRIFMPRYGKINERRHQLHEVIRLSGMNLIIDDTDHPKEFMMGQFLNELDAWNRGMEIAKKLKLKINWIIE